MSRTICISISYEKFLTLLLAKSINVSSPGHNPKKKISASIYATLEFDQSEKLKFVTWPIVASLIGQKSSVE